MKEGMKSSFGHLRAMKPGDLERAVDGMFEVMAVTGVVVKDQEMRSVLRDYGCKTDDAMERAWFPREVVKKALDSCPKGFKVKAMEEASSIFFRPGETTYFTNADGMKLADLYTGDTHDATREEFYRFIKLLDALPNIDIQNCFPVYGFRKVPECMKMIESTACKYRISSKPQIEGGVYDNYIFQCEMAKALDTDLLQIVASAAPMTYFENTAEQIRAYTNADMPFHFAAGPTRGLTAPMSAIGAAIANNAETMAGIVMAQAVKPGSRVWVNSMIQTPNMLDGKPASGDIGNSITDMCFNEMWNALGIPCWSNAASWTSSKIIDYQAGYELTMALMVQAMSGTSLISYQSGMHAQLGVNGAKAIIDDDIVGMVKRLMAGPDLSDEAMAVDLINSTGPMPGSYMNSDMTLENWREECYVPKVGNRQTFEQWDRSGRKNILEAAAEKEQEIYRSPFKNVLTPQQEDSVEQILKDARAYYRKKGLISDEEWKEYMEDVNSDNYPYA